VKGVFNEDWLKKRKRKRRITRGAWKPPEKKGEINDREDCQQCASSPGRIIIKDQSGGIAPHSLCTYRALASFLPDTS
jgi:hypothetical protein